MDLLRAAAERTIKRGDYSKPPAISLVPKSHSSLILIRQELTLEAGASRLEVP
jgi:hypothetical protein